MALYWVAHALGHLQHKKDVCRCYGLSATATAHTDIFVSACSYCSDSPRTSESGCCNVRLNVHGQHTELQT